MVFVHLVGTPIRALCFCQGTAELMIRRSAPSGAVAGRFMELRGAYSRSGGGMKRVLPAKVEEGLQCAVGWFLGPGVAEMRAVQAIVSWPARPAGCANGAKRSAAPLWFWVRWVG